MPTVFEEQLPHAEGFIVSEANGTLSRDRVTVIQGASILYAGTVVGERDDGKYDQLDPESSEGNDVAAGILLSDVDPKDGDAAGVIIERLAEVRASDLRWPDGISSADQNTAIAALLARNIKVRAGATRFSIQTT